MLVLLESVVELQSPLLQCGASAGHAEQVAPESYGLLATNVPSVTMKVLE